MDVSRLKRAVTVLSVGALLGTAGNAFAAPPDTPQVAQWIAQLGSPNFCQREQATGKLDAVGAAALPSLKKARLSSDAETRRRAALLIADIERRVLTEQLLTPTRVSFEYKDTPLPEAVADLAKKSGQPLILNGDVSRWSGRKVTLRVKDAPAWQALERFYQAAGISEENTPRQSQIDEIPVPGVRRFGRGRWRFPVWNPLQAAQPVELVLVEGKPVELPTDLAGAARIRALPLPGQQPTHAELLLAVALEAKVPLLRTVEVRIDRALDDRGQPRHLKPHVADTDFGDEFLVASGRIVVNLGAPGQLVVNPNGGLPYLLTNLPPGRIAVPLTTGEKPARLLREVRGVVAVEVQTPPQRVLCVEDFLRATGRTVKGDKGGAVVVREVARDDSGIIQVWLDVVLPADAPQLNWVVPPATTNGFPNGPRTPAGELGLVLLDTKGKAFELLEESDPHQFEGKTAHGVTLLFKPREGQAEPGCLVYSMARTAVIEVPFQLKDVPLP